MLTIVIIIENIIKIENVRFESFHEKPHIQLMERTILYLLLNKGNGRLQTKTDVSISDVGILVHTTLLNT